MVGVARKRITSPGRCIPGARRGAPRPHPVLPPQPQAQAKQAIALPLAFPVGIKATSICISSPATSPPPPEFFVLNPQNPPLFPESPIHQGAPGPPSSAPDPRSSSPSPAGPAPTTMGNSASAAVPALCAGVAISAVELVHFLDSQPGAGAAEAAVQAPALGSAVRAFLPLSAAWGLFIASVALMYHHHLQRAGAGNWRMPGPVAFTLCASAGLLEFFLFVVQVPGGGGGADADHSAAAAREELGRAALSAIPGAATATFFLSMLLVIVGHIRAGGEGGGGAAVAGNGPIEAPAGGVLAKMAVGAAAGLVALMAMAALFSA